MPTTCNCTHTLSAHPCSAALGCHIVGLSRSSPYVIYSALRMDTDSHACAVVQGAPPPPAAVAASPPKEEAPRLPAQWDGRVEVLHMVRMQMGPALRMRARLTGRGRVPEDSPLLHPPMSVLEHSQLRTVFRP